MKQKTLHVIFKTHLDLGFTGMAQDVCSRYLEEFIPRALDLARATRDRGSQRFVWTTGSWIIDHFLRCAPPEQVRRMEAAIEDGDILWHALPFTTHTELMSPELFRHGLSISSELDRRFGKTTTAAKMSDVPGHTRSMIPCLREYGITYLHIGVNAGSSTVKAPPRFRWRHPGGEEILVSYGAGYDATTEDAGADDLLFFAHTGDNHGPPDAEAVAQEFAALGIRYPDNTPVTSSLDAYAQTLAARRDTLPVIEGEFGDTWIHGAGSDPAKVARYRCVDRFLSDQDTSETRPLIQAARQQLLLVPEHTWGKDEKSHLKDYNNYTLQHFNDARKADRVAAPHEDEFGARDGDYRYSDFEASWEEQRQYVHQAIEALEGSSLHQPLLAELDTLTPRRRAHRPQTARPIDGMHQLGGFGVRFCEQTGALTSCVDDSGQEWAANGPLALFQYQSFDAASYEVFLGRYNPDIDNTGSWARPDFTKPGIEHTEGLVRQELYPAAAEFEREGDNVWVDLALPERQPWCYGIPACIQLHYVFGSDHIGIELQWFEKSACRLPEATWLGFGLPDTGEWLMEKMAYPVSPLEVIEGGNRALHALDSGRVYQKAGTRLFLQSTDAPLFSPGRPRILEFDVAPPDLAEGWHINLHNNLWGTNFPMWFAEDMKFRFQLGRRSTD